MFRKIVDDSNESIAILDRDARFVYVNNAYAGQFGYERDELEGSTADEFIHPDERLEAASLYEDLFKKR